MASATTCIICWVYEVIPALTYDLWPQQQLVSSVEYMKWSRLLLMTCVSYITADHRMERLAWTPLIRSGQDNMRSMCRYVVWVSIEYRGVHEIKHNRWRLHWATVLPPHPTVAHPPLADVAETRQPITRPVHYRSRHLLCKQHHLYTKLRPTFIME